MSIRMSGLKKYASAGRTANQNISTEHSKKHRLSEHDKRCFSFGLMVSFVQKGLRHLVELQGQFALLVSSVVLVQDVLGNGLVQLLNSSLVSDAGFFLVAGFHCGIVLLQCGAQLALEHFVLQGLGFDYFYPLLGGLDIRHFDFLPFILYGMMSDPACLRLRGSAVQTISYKYVLYHNFPEIASAFRDFKPEK